MYCIIGDLSFFYDRNALWNRYLRGNLRILLLNNGGGGIFEKFSEHLQEEEDARNVMAQDFTTAEGFAPTIILSIIMRMMKIRLRRD